MSHTGPKSILAFPATQTGHVALIRVQEETESASIIPAHQSAIAALALDRNGTLLATASEKGTLVRVFDAKTGKLLFELRRGADKADILGLSFSEDSSKLCVASDKGTVHIFKLDPVSNPNTTDHDTYTSPFSDGLSMSGSSNKQSSLSFMKDMLPKYFSSQWSFAQCRLSEEHYLATFGKDPNTIIGNPLPLPHHPLIFVVATFSGSFYRYRFDTIRGGECTRELYVKFLNSGSEW